MSPICAAAALAGMVPMGSTALMSRGECIPAPLVDSTMAGLLELTPSAEDRALADSMGEAAFMAAEADGDSSREVTKP